MKNDVEAQPHNSTNTDDSESKKDASIPLNLDDVLTNELGQFGWFQLRNILLVAVPIMMSTFINEYIFSAADTPHRCRIPECGEVDKLYKYDPEWIANTIPNTEKGLSSCKRYSPLSVGSNGTLSFCPATLFNHSNPIPCEGFVYATNNTVVYEFDLACQEWLRALAGTLNSIGTLLVLPITGYISDRFGRRFALVISVLNLGVIGLVRAFSVNYTMYLILQILQTTLGAGTYSTAYIFATELVGPKYRVITSATSSSLFGLGQVILGSIAWVVSPWRSMLMALHIPCLLIISYYWLLSESVRWLLSKNKYSEAKKVLETVARLNNTSISDKSLNALLKPSESCVTVPKSEDPGLVRTILRSPVLLRRVCTTPIWWITAIFVYYGLSINSTGLSDTMHLNYILTCGIEIPGFYTAVLVLDRIGRKATISSCYFICAVCNIAFVFIPSATEMVGPKYRVITSATSSSLFGLGQVILGSIAWVISPWRSMLMALHIPCLLIISYYWLLSESVRWLLSKNKYSEAKKVLETVARLNNTSISDKSLNALLKPSESSATVPKSVDPGLVRTILRSPVLLRRVCTTPIWWITAIFVYYGLSINSTGLSDTMHLNYILTCGIEIPGFYTAVLVLDRIGRKATISSCYFICAVCNIAFVFIPSELTILRLIVYLLGKFSVSTAMTSLYLFTSELYPTEFRHTLLAFSSMVGRIGSITAPLTPVLMEYWHGIPSFMFAGMAILSALLVFTQPETLGAKLPDTLAEAEAIGKQKSTDEDSVKIERKSNCEMFALE